MKKNFQIIAAFFVCAFFLLALRLVHAQVLRYPIAELDNCRDAKECSLYCDIPQNRASCWSYGKYKLVNVLGESTVDENKVAKEHGITFPIVQLGNCTNVASCKTFCEKSENHQTCMDFARSKGLGQYKQQNDLLQKAKQELGCDSIESCKALCENPVNREKCMKLADQNQPPELKAKKEEFIQKAKEVLGCDSYASCKSFCENPDNREKCMKFADQHMPPEMKQQMHEGSQTNETPPPCNSEESCRKYCQENPSECPGYKQSQDYKHDQQNQPQPTYFQPTNYQNYSPQNSPAYNYPTQTYQPPQNNPTTYQNPPPQNYQPPPQPPPGDDPATQCSKAPGCSWTGSTCQCPH